MSPDRDPDDLDDLDEGDDAPEATGPIRVLVVDDHVMVAESIVRLLDTEDDIVVLGAETTAGAAVEAARRDHPDVVLMDYQLPDRDGVSAARDIIAERPETRIIILTGTEDVRVLPEALEAGCSGYVEKTTAFSILAAAVRSAHGGNVVIPPDRVTRLLPETGWRLGSDLSERELEVLKLLGEGRSTAEIAETLFLSHHTVRNHVRNILEKLGAHSRLEAVAVAAREGILEL